MAERKYPVSPYICGWCGKDTSGHILIDGRGICKECYKKYNLEEVMGFSLEDLFEECDQ